MNPLRVILYPQLLGKFMADDCATTWTSADLAAIEAAIATGALRVRYADREVQYASLDALLAARRIIRAALGCCDNSSLAAGRRYGGYSKGL
ncbi:phage head-tail joining protein [Bradyrhizobium sp.]|uniref:phage head-tail joining protein n=1 Tax=Bradyrhizobium sp. TaxID=376 RepID=UPI0039E2A44D